MRTSLQDTSRDVARDKTIYAQRLAELHAALSSPDTDPRQRDDLHLQMEDLQAQVSTRTLETA